MMLLFGKLFIFLTFTRLPTVTLQALPKGLTCVTDYFKTIRCFLDSTVVPKVSRKASSWLEFHETTAFFCRKNCTLSVGKDGYECTLIAECQWKPTFTNKDEFNISLCYVKGVDKECSSMISSFKPSEHIKPCTPYNLTVQHVNGQYNFTWMNGYETHRYGNVLPFQYTLSYHKVGNPDSVTSLHVARQMMAKIPEAELDSGVEYIAKVCSEVEGSKYGGTKSDWSTEVKWKTHNKTPTNVYSRFKIAIPICFATAVLILLLLPVARNKIKEITWVATPAPFFYQLPHHHQGDLQCWLTKGHEQQIYREEISKIDMITEITAINEDKEWITNPYPAAQCHTPYVGPSAEIWLPFPMCDMRNAGNNPSKEPEILPLTSALEDSVLCLNMPIAGDGFLSLEDLEPKEDISQNTETLTKSPKPSCFTQNYCTLTNTATGLIPTFVTGPNEQTPEPDSPASAPLNLPLDLQTEENTLEVITLTLDSLQIAVSE